MVKKFNKMNKKEHIKKKLLLESLEKSLGIVSTACQKADVSRGSFYRWYNDDEDFKNKVDEIDNVKLDFVESQLFKNIQKEKERSIIFYLQHKGHKRGYIQKQNINLTSSDEEINKIEIEIVKPTRNSSSGEES